MASEPPYRGLLIDWGGVMTTSVFDAFRVFCEREGLSSDAVAQHFRSHQDSRELLIGLETGALSEEDFEPRFADILGVPAPDLIDRLFAAAQPEHAMLDVVRKVRDERVRTGLISNSWGTRRYDRRLLDELFDGVVLSGDVGIRKPSPEIYQLGAQRVGLGPADCVFVDDLPFNLKPAADLGMATVHHTSTEKTVAELELLLGVEL